MELFDLTNTTFKILGCGGTKTVIGYKNLAIALPNNVDGADLRARWPQIVSDELKMSEYLQSLGIPTLKFSECIVKTKDSNLALETLYSQPFSEYAKGGIYIIDRKNTDSTQWSRKFPDISLFEPGVDKYSVKTWLPLFNEMLKDVLIISKNRVNLSYDSINLCFCKRGSKWHSGSELPFEIRIFCFDFGSKYGPIELNDEESVNPDRFVYFIVEYAVWEELCPEAFGMPDNIKKLYHEICNQLLPLIEN